MYLILVFIFLFQNLTFLFFHFSNALQNCTIIKKYFLHSNVQLFLREKELKSSGYFLFFVLFTLFRVEVFLSVAYLAVANLV